MAEKAATPKETDQADSPQIAHFRFREKELSDKVARITAMSDAEFGDSALGFNRQEAIRRNQAALEEVRRELKKPTT